MMWLLIVEVLAALIAAARGWGITPLLILGGTFGLGIFMGASSELTASTISTMSVIDYIATAVLVIMALVGKPSQPSQTQPTKSDSNYQGAYNNFFQSQETREPQRVKCPFCAELIMPDAKICRFCGRDLPNAAVSSAVDKLGAYVAEMPETSDERINKLLQGFQDPMAYKRESALNEVERAKLNDPRIVKAVEILATSDHVGSIRSIATRVLNKINQQSTSRGAE